MSTSSSRLSNRNPARAAATTRISSRQKTSRPTLPCRSISTFRGSSTRRTLNPTRNIRSAASAPVTTRAFAAITHCYPIRCSSFGKNVTGYLRSSTVSATILFRVTAARDRRATTSGLSTELSTTRRRFVSALPESASSPTDAYFTTRSVSTSWMTCVATSTRSTRPSTITRS